jgi:hypothetical protein
MNEMESYIIRNILDDGEAIELLVVTVAKKKKMANEACRWYLRHWGVGLGSEGYVLALPAEHLQWQQLLNLAVRTTARLWCVIWECWLIARHLKKV